MEPRQRVTYGATVFILSFCLLAVMSAYYVSARKWNRRIEALELWQRDTTEAANALRRVAADAGDITLEGPGDVPPGGRNDHDPPAPVRAAWFASRVLSELGQERRTLETKQDADAEYIQWLEGRLAHYESGKPASWRELARRHAKTSVPN
jgi:hypothetical protein